MWANVVSARLQPDASSTVTPIPSSTATSRIVTAGVMPPTRVSFTVTPSATPRRWASSRAGSETIVSSITIGPLHDARNRPQSASVAHGCSRKIPAPSGPNSRTKRRASDREKPQLASAKITMSSPTVSRTASTRWASTIGSSPTLTCSRRYSWSSRLVWRWPRPPPASLPAPVGRAASVRARHRPTVATAARRWRGRPDPRPRCRGAPSRTGARSSPPPSVGGPTVGCAGRRPEIADARTVTPAN